MQVQFLSRRLFLSGTFLVFCLAGPGCMMLEPAGPEASRSTLAIPDAWSAAAMTSFDAGTAPAQNWWSLLKDAQLEQLIKQTRAKNLDLQTAAERIREFSALRRQAKGGYSPTLDGKGSLIHAQRSEATSPLPAGFSRADDYYNIGVDLSWEVDFWGRIKRTLESADNVYEAARENYRDAEVLLIAQTALAYIDVRTLQQRMAYAEDNLQKQNSTLHLTKERFKAELVPELDVHQSELNLARTEASLPVFRAGLAQAMHRLGVLTGEPPQALYHQLKAPQAIPEIPSQIGVSIPAELMRQRPDVRAAERLLAAQAARAGAAKANLYPVFALAGSFEWDALESDDLFSGESEAYSIGPVFRWNLFDGARIRSAVRVEESRTKQLMHQYEQTILLALEDVEGAMVALVEEQKRCDALARAVDAATKASEMVLDLYKNGLTDFQNVLDMQLALTRAQDEWAVSRGEQVKALVRLYKAFGGGW